MHRPSAGLVVDVLVTAVPASVALLLLVLAGAVAPLPALAAWLPALLLAAWIAQRRHERLRRAEHYVEAIDASASPDPPTGVVLGDGDLDAALRRLGRNRMRYRAELEAQDAFQARMLAALPDPILLLDDAVTVVEANPAARELLGDSPLGRPLGSVLRDPGLLASVEGAIGQARESDLALDLTGPVRRAFRVRVVPVRTSDGRIAVLVSLRERTDELVIERVRSDFVANASHELRTPLTTIRGFIETLRGPARDDEPARDRFLAIMDAEASRMTRLLDDLLSLSRIEQLAHSLPQTMVDPAAIASAVVRALQPLAASRAVTLRLDAAETVPPIKGDADQLHQVLSNLVDNAIKYGGEGKIVRVIVEVFDAAPPQAGPLGGRKAVAIAIEDQGEGLPREILPRLTERFFRVDSARSRKLGGTGLGLAIVKHAVRRHRGHLAIASELGKGSRFTVFLPAG